jgi:N-acetyl-D-muramate 6-phosphate phosphatase
MLFDRARVQALCFDIDGTLSDTDDQLVAQVERIVRPLRFFLPRHDTRGLARRLVMGSEAPGNFLIGIPDFLGIDGLLSSLGDALYRRRLEQNRRSFLLIPGARATLEALHPHYPMCIVSARGEHSSQAFLDQFDLQPFFRCIATAQTCRHTKPYPDPILWAAQQMGIFPANCLMIGDTTVDIRAGKAAGAQTVGVLSGFGEADELCRSGADVILNSVEALASLLVYP